jgi:predicted RNase H-like HicB family nuclease
MAQQFQVFVQYDANENAWTTVVPALDHMSTFGSTRDEALANTREAIVGYLEAADREGIQLTIDSTPAELVQIASRIARRRTDGFAQRLTSPNL